MQFLFGPMLGALSDRFGRRPVILFSLAALVVDIWPPVLNWPGHALRRPIGGS
jgi:MFS family permease